MPDVLQVLLSQIDPNPFQQRKEFNQAEIIELAGTIDRHGLLQPVTLRPHPTVEGRYQLIAGERRFRAHKHLKREFIAAIVLQDIDDAKLEELALIENVQRSNLLPIEEAEGYQRLLEKYNGDMTLVEKKTGKSRDLIEGRVALLSLDPRVQEMVNRREVGLEQAALLQSVEESEEQYTLAKHIKRTNMDVNRLKGMLQSKAGAKKGANSPATGTVKKISVKQLSPAIMSLSDNLDKVDYDSIKDVETSRTLQRQLKLLAEQLANDVIPKLERRDNALGGQGTST